MIVAQRACNAVVLAIILWSGLLAGCQRASAPQPPAASQHAQPLRTAPHPPIKRGAAASVEVGEIVVADPAGKRLWRASARSIEWDYDRQQALLRDVQCQFTDEGKLALEARAPVVIAYLGERRVVLLGGVGPPRAKSRGGVTARAPATKTFLRADRIEWDVRSKEVYATGNVKYVRSDFVLTGERLRADLDLRKARLEGGVQMQAVEPGGGK